MNQTLIQSAKALRAAFDQEWITSLRSRILKSCEEMIPLLHEE